MKKSKRNKRKNHFSEMKGDVGEKERGRTLKRRARAPPSRPRMLSWQQMASFNVHRKELHDLLQQRGTREKRSLGNGHTDVDGRDV